VQEALVLHLDLEEGISVAHRQPKRGAFEAGVRGAFDHRGRGFFARTAHRHVRVARAPFLKTNVRKKQLVQEGLELELEVIQTQMAQKLMLQAEVYCF
jgi:hypothetical protein